MMLVGLQLGLLLGNAWAGVGLGALAFLLIAYRRVAQLLSWLSGGAPGSEPPVQGGMLAEVADRFRQAQSRLDQQLREASGAVERLRESYAALKDGVVMLGPDNGIEWANASALKLLGLRYPQDVGQPLLNLVRDPDFAHYLLRGDFDSSFVLETQGGLSLDLQATVFGANRKVLFVRDITALSRLENTRRDFVANISHELRTPLTVITGYLDTLRQIMPQDSPAISRAFGQMQQQALRMEHLLRDLMLLSKLEGMRETDETAEESIAVCAMLESIRENALASCGGERRMELACEPGLRLRGSRLQVESVFSNLVFNAVKYSSPGGHIRIAFAREEAGCGVFRVSDDGIGIDPVHIPRLTERFYRVDKSRSVERGGTGLGLAIVKHSLKHLDGELLIESRPGAGSTFTCRFPPARISVVKPA